MDVLMLSRLQLAASTFYPLFLIISLTAIAIAYQAWVYNLVKEKIISDDAAYGDVHSAGKDTICCRKSNNSFSFINLFVEVYYS